jgi:hypothetical protein
MRLPFPRVRSLLWIWNSHTILTVHRHRVTMMSMVFWVIVMCGLETAQCFRGMYRLHLQCQGVSQAQFDAAFGLLQPVSC